MNPLSNPYYDKSKNVSYSDLHKLTSAVSEEDFHFLKRRFPAENLSDRVISNLFKLLINELRIVDATNPIESAWYIDSASWDVLRSVIQRLETGRPVRDASARAESGATDGVCETLCDTPLVSPDEKGRPKVRKSRDKSKTLVPGVEEK